MDATLKEVNIRRSIKKFFIDADLSIPVYFDRIITGTEYEQLPKTYINVTLQGLYPASVSEAYMYIYLTSKYDFEGDELAATRDIVIELLEPGKIDLYDTYTVPWTKAGGMCVFLSGQSRIAYNADQSKSVWIPSVLKWGAVWT